MKRVRYESDAFSRIDRRFHAEFVKIDSHHEELLYKKSRERREA